MRLLTWNSGKDLRLTEDLIEHIPPYAILSHTWGPDSEEVTFADINHHQGQSRAGYAKIRFCIEQATRDQIDHVWIDTCCIDKTNHVELSEAILSMFRWYRDATKCYVYLTDVSVPYRHGDQEADGRHTQDSSWESSLRASRWFTRCWTLQELLAPAFVEFFSCEGRSLGTKTTLARQIHEITSIPVEALNGASLSSFTDTELLRWTRERKTKKVEDRAYCLLGIFGVFIPLLYGERENAFIRLQEAVDHLRGRRVITHDSPTEAKSAGPDLTPTMLVKPQDCVGHDEFGHRDSQELAQRKPDPVLPQPQHTPDSSFDQAPQIDPAVSASWSQEAHVPNGPAPNSGHPLQEAASTIDASGLDVTELPLVRWRPMKGAMQQRKSPCDKGMCPCLCHRSRRQSRALITLSSASLVIKCHCPRKDFLLNVSVLRRLVSIRLYLDLAQDLKFNASLRVRATVKRTSPGFVLIEKCSYGLLEFEQARRDLRALRDAKVIDFTDITPEGDGLLEQLIRMPWTGRYELQFQLLEFLLSEIVPIDNERLLELALTWVGEGPFVDLLKNLAYRSLDASVITPKLFCKWPRAASSDWIWSYHSGDSFYLRTIALLIRSDPEFGGTSELQAAVLRNNRALVGTLVAKSRQNINVLSTEVNFLGQSILHLAVLNPSMVDHILHVFPGISLDVRDASGTTPLMYAMSYGVAESVHLLLKTGADDCCRDDLNRFCAWDYALVCAEDDLLASSIDLVASLRPDDVLEVVEYCLWARVYRPSARSSDIECRRLSYLLGHATGHEFVSPSGNTLLHLCRRSDAELLLNSNTMPVNQANKHGYTPLMVISRFQDPALVGLLVNKGASVDLIDKHERNALHHLISSLAPGFFWRKFPESTLPGIESAAMLMSCKINLDHGDECHCFCSLSGCTPLAYFLTSVHDFQRQNQNIAFTLCLLECFNMMQLICPADVQAVLEALFRRQRFDELGMTHTCCRCPNASLPSARASSRYKSPIDDESIHAQEGVSLVEEHQQVNSIRDQDIDAGEIRVEEGDLAQILQDDCDKFSVTAHEDVEAAWLMVLSRRVVMMEEAIQDAKAKHEKRKAAEIKRTSARRTKEYGEIICSSPLLSVDHKKDMIVEHYSISPMQAFWDQEIRLEDCAKQYLAVFEKQAKSFPTLTGGSVDLQVCNDRRRQLTAQFVREVKQLRSAPKEQKDWDMNVEDY